MIGRIHHPSAAFMVIMAPHGDEREEMIRVSARLCVSECRFMVAALLKPVTQSTLRERRSRFFLFPNPFGYKRRAACVTPHSLSHSRVRALSPYLLYFAMQLSSASGAASDHHPDRTTNKRNDEETTITTNAFMMRPAASIDAGAAVVSQRQSTSCGTAAVASVGATTAASVASAPAAAAPAAAVGPTVCQQVIALVSLATVSSSFGVAMKMSQTSTGEYPYNPMSVTAMTELFKLTASLIVITGNIIYDMRRAPVASSTTKTSGEASVTGLGGGATADQVVVPTPPPPPSSSSAFALMSPDFYARLYRFFESNWSYPLVAHCFGLALAYAIVNLVTFGVLAHAPASSFFLLKASSPVITALLLYYFVHRPVSPIQWLSVVLQGFGLVVTQYDACTRSASLSVAAYAFIATNIVVSCGAGVWNEHVIKSYGSSVNAQNVILYIFGITVNVILYLIMPASSLGASKTHSSAASLAASDMNATAAAALAITTSVEDLMRWGETKGAADAIALGLSAASGAGGSGHLFGHFFDGYSASTVAVIVSTGCIGLVITAVYKYADVVVKTFGIAGSTAVMYLLELLEVMPSRRLLNPMATCAGAGMIFYASFAYIAPAGPPAASGPTPTSASETGHHGGAPPPLLLSGAGTTPSTSGLQRCMHVLVSATGGGHQTMTPAVRRRWATLVSLGLIGLLALVFRGPCLG